MRYVLSALVLWTLGSALSAKPVRKVLPPDPVEPKKVFKIYDDYSGETIWGTLTQFGEKIYLTGHPHWSAEGTIRPDGKVVIRWIHNSDEREGISIYETDGYRLVGQWGWSDECTLEGDQLSGSFRSDTIRETAPEVTPAF